jgi:hypothetical protein
MVLRPCELAEVQRNASMQAVAAEEARAHLPLLLKTKVCVLPAGKQRMAYNTSTMNTSSTSKNVSITYS